MTEATHELTILVADDEPDLLELLVYRLSHSGFDVLAARDGEEALALATGRAPDLAVLDVMMPGINGFDLTRKLRAVYPDRRIPVILLTAKVQEDDVEKGFEAGADDYLRKPFNPSELVARVWAVLGRS
jgi:DNA-binding response OmpR family regulator